MRNTLEVDGDFAERPRRRELEDRLKDHGLEALYSLKAVQRSMGYEIPRPDVRYLFGSFFSLISVLPRRNYV